MKEGDAITSSILGKKQFKSYTYYAYLYGVRNGYVKQASMSNSKSSQFKPRPLCQELNGQVYVCNGRTGYASITWDMEFILRG